MALNPEGIEKLSKYFEQGWNFAHSDRIGPALNELLAEGAATAFQALLDDAKFMIHVPEIGDDTPAVIISLGPFLATVQRQDLADLLSLDAQDREKVCKDSEDSAAFLKLPPEFDPDYWL